MSNVSGFVSCTISQVTCVLNFIVGDLCTCLRMQITFVSSQIASRHNVQLFASMLFLKMKKSHMLHIAMTLLNTIAFADSFHNDDSVRNLFRISVWFQPSEGLRFQHVTGTGCIRW